MLARTERNKKKHRIPRERVWSALKFLKQMSQKQGCETDYIKPGFLSQIMWSLEF